MFGVVFYVGLLMVGGNYLFLIMIVDFLVVVIVCVGFWFGGGSLMLDCFYVSLVMCIGEYFLEYFVDLVGVYWCWFWFFEFVGVFFLFFFMFSGLFIVFMLWCNFLVGFCVVVVDYFG